MVAATYVRDIETSRAFYELLGFHEQSAGKAATSAWSALHHNGHSVLLTSTQPPLGIPQFPLTVAGAFIATESDQGIEAFLSRRDG